MINAELHYTIKPTEDFLAFLKRYPLNIKLMDVHLFAKDFRILIDVHTMVTYKVKVSTFKQLLEEADRLKNFIQQHVYIERFKIEVCPDSLKSVPIDPLYVETHFEFAISTQQAVVNNNQFLKDYLVSKTKGNSISLTYRNENIDYGTYLIKQHYEKLVSKYSDMKPLELEYCIIDTNKDLDNNWINNVT